jgi:hypothetical protein
MRGSSIRWTPLCRAYRIVDRHDQCYIEETIESWALSGQFSVRDVALMSHLVCMEVEMTKRITIITALIVLCAGALVAQTSIEAGNSFNIFRNSLDAAFDVAETESGPVFSELKDTYLFAGLTNWFGVDTDTSSADYFRIGAYLPGAVPFAILGNLDMEVVSSSRSNGTTQNTANVPVVVGTTTTNYTYTTEDSTVQRAFLESTYLYTSLSVLTRIGGINFGLRPTINYQNNTSGAAINTWVDANTTQTNQYYYNAAGVGVEPEQTLDYTRTIVQTDPDTAFTFYLSAPVFVNLGTIGLYANAYFNDYRRNQSSTYGTTYTNPENAIAFNNVVFQNDVTDVTGNVQFGLNTLLVFPASGGSKDDRFELGVNASGTVGTPGNYSSIYREQNIDFAGGGADFTITADNQNTTINETRVGKFLGNVGVSGQYYVYFTPAANISFGLAPYLSCSTYASGSTYYATQNVQVDMTDGDLDGSYDAAADTITTTTTNYYDNEDGDTQIVNIGFSLPTALKFKIADWPFSFLLANSITVTNSMNIVTNKATRTDTSVVVTDGTGTVVSTTDTTVSEETSTNSFTTSWSFGNNFNIAMIFDLPADITLSVTLNGQDLLDFSDLVAEVSIPLHSTAKK